MNKPLRIVVAVAALGLALPASSWVFGKQIETALDAHYGKLGELPHFRIVAREFDRGWFRSTETVTFELNGELLRDAAGAPGDEELSLSAEQGAPAEPVRFTLRSAIVHGPLPGMTTIAAAVSDTELVLDDSARAVVARLFGDRKPFELNTVYGFTGAGTATLKIPEFVAEQTDENGAAMRLTWQGLTATVDFGRDLRDYRLRGEVPGVQIEDGSSRLTATGLHMEADQRHIFDDEPFLFAGTQKFALAELKLVPQGVSGEQGGAVTPMQLKRLTYDVNVPVKGEFVDINAKMAAEVVQVGNRNFGPAHYDLSFNHMHARSLADLSRAVMGVYRGDVAASSPQAQGEAMLAAMERPAKALLAQGPEFSLDRVSFSSPYGEAEVAARLRGNDLQPEDLGNPLALMAKLELSGRMSFPERLLTDLQGLGAASSQDRQVDAQAMEKLLSGYAAQGLLQRDAGIVKSSLEYKGGQLKVNGTLVDPFSMMAQR